MNTIRPILTTSHVFLVIAFLFFGQASFAQVNTISFSIDSKKLFVGQFANDEPDYTMGVGDIDGDGKQDVVVRVWSEGNRNGDDGYKQFESWMF
ncbi:MAG: FG-GAP repeat protein, partial [bacterium]